MPPCRSSVLALPYRAGCPVGRCRVVSRPGPASEKPPTRSRPVGADLRQRRGRVDSESPRDARRARPPRRDNGFEYPESGSTRTRTAVAHARSGDDARRGTFVVLLRSRSHFPSRPSSPPRLIPRDSPAASARIRQSRNSAALLARAGSPCRSSPHARCVCAPGLANSSIAAMQSAACRDGCTCRDRASLRPSRPFSRHLHRLGDVTDLLLRQCQGQGVGELMF